MQRQKSFVNEVNTLYLVATPIGNLDDMTFRAINILKNVDVIFAEDTRVTSKLLSHFEINKKLLSYHEHNKERASDIVLDYLKNGDVALVSDAGLPVISDPGYEIAKLAILNGYNVSPIPGANAALSALISSGISPQCFMFYGFLGNKASSRKKELEMVKDFKNTIIFYEAPHRIKDTLIDMLDILGDRYITLAREMTKKFEEFIRGNISEILEIVDELKGEMVIVVEGNKETINYDDIKIVDHVKSYIDKGYSEMEAIKKVANDRGVKKQEIYKEIKIK